MSVLVTETPGSGREWEDGRWVNGERIFVGLRTATDYPREGGTNTNDLFTSVVTGESGRTAVAFWRCVSVRKDDWSLPGCRIWTARYRGVRGKPGGAVSVTATVVAGSDNEWSNAQDQFGEMIYVGAATDVFPAPDGFCFFTPRGGSIESGVTGRRCVSRRLDPVSLPGAIVCHATYKAVLTLT